MNRQTLEKQYGDLTEERLLYCINHVCYLLNTSRSTLYALMNDGQLQYKMFGAERRIPSSEVQRLAREGIPKIPAKIKKPVPDPDYARGLI